MEGKIDECNDKLDTLLSQNASKNYSDSREVVLEFQNQYKSVSTDYKNLITALSDYASDIESSDKKEALQVAYDKVAAYYTISGDEEGEYYVVAGTSDIVITGRVSSVYEVSYDFTDSSKYSYSLNGLASDDGQGTGTAAAGTEMYIYVSNNSSYSSSHFSETHYVKDADGNKLTLTSKTYTSGSYYYFTMPEGPITVYGYSAYHSGIYSPNPLSEGDTFYSGGLQYEITSAVKKNLTVKVIGLADKEATSIMIPDTVTIDGVTYKVTAIGSGAFKNSENLKKIVIGKNVTTVGEKAFYNCKALVTIKGGENVTVIGKKAFYGSNALKYNSLKKVTITSSDKKTVKTGDTTRAGALLVVMLGAFMIVGTVIWYKRRRLR